MYVPVPCAPWSPGKLHAYSAKSGANSLSDGRSEESPVRPPSQHVTNDYNNLLEVRSMETLTEPALARIDTVERKRRGCHPFDLRARTDSLPGSSFEGGKK